MTQDQPAPPPTREDLERTLWELTEWRGGAETMDRLLAAIDEYARVDHGAELARLRARVAEDDAYAVPGIAYPSPADLELVARVTNHLAVDEVQPALEAEPDHDWQALGRELAALTWRYAADATLTAAAARRVGELSGAFGHAFAEAHWMRVAARYGDELAAAWLRELGDGTAFTPGLDPVEDDDPVPDTVLEAARKAFETRVNEADLEPRPPRTWETAASHAGTTTVHLVTITNPVPQVDAVEGVFEIEWDKVAPPRPYVAPAPAPMVNDDGEPMKPCRACGQPKVLAEFPKDSSCRDGHRNQCKLCVNGKASERRAGRSRTR